MLNYVFPVHKACKNGPMPLIHKLQNRGTANLTQCFMKKFVLYVVDFGCETCYVPCHLIA